MSWKSMLGLVAQSRSSKSRGKGWGVTVSCPGATAKGGVALALASCQKKQSRGVGSWMDVAGTVGEL